MPSPSNNDPMFGTMTTKLLQSSTSAGGGGMGSSALLSRSSASSMLGKAAGHAGMPSLLQLDGPLGAAASLGASLFVLRLAVYSYGAAPGLSLMGRIRRWLRKLLDEPDPSPPAVVVPTIADKQEEETDSGALVPHQGSCHCGSVQFEVLAPRTLMASNGPGKIQYRHTYVKTTNFRVYVGHECLRTYYVLSSNRHRQQHSISDGARKGAHGFCERCGVHVLYAPSRNSPMLGINVNCIKEATEGGTTKVRLSDKVDGIADGFPADGQWDTSDQLSTISEVTQPFHFQMNHTDSMERSGHWKQHYSRRSSSGLYSEGGVEDIPEEGPPIAQFYAATTTTSSISNTRRFVSASKFPPNPMTPTTMITSPNTSMDGDSYGDQITQLKVLVSHPRGSGATVGDDLTNDDISLSDDASLSSGVAFSVGGSKYRRSTGNMGSSLSPRLGGTAVVPTSSPEVRNQMRYFMGKYKHRSSNQQTGEHGSQQSMTTESTTASSLTSVAGSSGNESCTLG